MISSFTFFTIAFGMICIQMLVSIIQVREIQKTQNGFRGTGIIGMGHNRTLIRPGIMLYVFYNPSTDTVQSVKIMKGYTNFAKFKEHPEYVGMNLTELREKALEEDYAFFKRRRKRHPYNPDDTFKKKGALIQAVEKIEAKLIDQVTNPEVRPIPKIRRQEAR